MAINSNEFICSLIEAGVMPDLPIIRVVIDFQMEEPVKIFYETHAEKATLDLCLEKLLKGTDLDVKEVT